MVVGIDVFHKSNKDSVAAFVASYNSPQSFQLNDRNNSSRQIGCTKWYSRSIKQAAKQEYIDNLNIFMMGMSFYSLLKQNIYFKKIYFLINRRFIQV